MKVDLHTHFVPRDCFDMVDGAGRPFGPSVGRDTAGREVVVADGVSLGPVLPQLTDPDRRIMDMDRTGLDMQALSINPSSIFNDLDIAAALPLYRRYNDALAEVVTAYPDRFVGLATLPLQDVPAAVAELERSVGLGLGGLQLGSNLAGRNLDVPELRPLYQKAEQLDVPIFLHPYYVAAAERMSRYWLVNLVGNPMDTAIAVGSLIFGGVLHDHPALRFVVAHGGGAVPYIVGRWDHGYRELEVCQSVPEPPSTYLRRMFFDSLTHSDAARSYLVDVVGADRVVLGSDYPFPMGDPDPVAAVRRSVGLSPQARSTILNDTAVKHLRIAG